MSNLLFLLVLLLATESIAQESQPLRWESDSVMLFREGCVFGNDTIRPAFTNVTSSPVELIDLLGLSPRWIIANRSAVLRSIAPGERVEVMLIYRTSIQQGSSNQNFILRSAVGERDTLRVIADVTGTGLGPKFHDTVAMYSFPLGFTADWIVPRSTSGNRPFVHREFRVEGDPEFNIQQDFLRDSTAGGLNLHFYFTPNRPDTFQATVFMRATECDSLYSITARFIGRARFEERVHWDRYRMDFAAEHCETTSTGEVVLMNSGTIDNAVESIEIIGQHADRFSILSTSPPNRMSNFNISPGPWEAGIKYLIQYEPRGEASGYEAKLVVRTTTGVNDTMTLTGFAHSARLRVADTVSVNFGTIPLDSLKTIYPRLLNLGSRPFKVTGLTFPSNASIEGLAIDTVIEPRSFHNFAATIRGEEAGMLRVPVSIQGETCDRSDTVTLTGEVTIPQSVRPLANTVAVELTGRTLHVRHLEPMPLNYRIVNVTGRTIASGRVTDSALISLEGSAAGIYFLEIEHHGSRSVTKLIVN